MERRVLFDHDRLDAYRLGRAATREVQAVLTKLPRGHAEMVDQARRSCLSLTLNTAEGAGEFAPKEKTRFYRIARRSATEAAAVLDNFVDEGVLDEDQIAAAREVLSRVTGALTRLIQSVDPEWSSARQRKP